MTVLSFSVSGGDKIAKHLQKLAASIKKGSELKVGFLAGSTDAKTGESIPLRAFINEYGGTATIPAHEVTVYRKVGKDGSFLHDGKFVKRKQSNFSTTHEVGEHTITIPARPFFRRMVRMGREHWGQDLGGYFVKNQFDGWKALQTMGVQMAGELQDSIHAQVYAPLAASTIARKGNDQQLVDTSAMWRAVNFEVDI